LPSENVPINRNLTRRSGAPGGGTVFEKWTNLKERTTTEVSGENVNIRKI